ncbi:hypothetical protein INR49_028165, partial [Caranx melampygus]
MLIIIHILLMLKVGRCTEAYSFETKTVDVGESVNLTYTLVPVIAVQLGEPVTFTCALFHVEVNHRILH